MTEQYILIVFLIIGSAFFSSSEIAYASANKSRLAKAAESGNARGKWANYISINYDKALCSVLIGNNLVNIASSAVATIIAINLFGSAGVAIATVVMTIILLIFGEILPKQIGKIYCDSYAIAISPFLRIFMIIVSPLVFFFTKFTELVSKLWIATAEDTSFTYENLTTIIETVEDEGIIDEGHSELLQSAIEFDEIEVREIITHRVDMLAVDINDKAKDIINVALESEFSRIPVYDDSIDKIIGVLSVNRLLRTLIDEKNPDIRELLSEPIFVPRSKKLPAALDQMRKAKRHIAIVTDEYGGTMGIVTMEDILEELVGDIWDETDEIHPDIVEETENRFIMAGDLILSDFLEHIDVDDPELEDHVITVGGWATEVLEDYAKVGDTFDYKNYTITVTEVDDLRVTELEVKENEKITEEE
ncbi:MAG: HlyC/CorC family transporter [Ruminococcaceae bacterium]|nr:HlyC/CorC family transporter [Oscillospiraceae bacterium]